MPNAMNPSLRFKVNTYLRRILALGWDPHMHTSEDGTKVTIVAINPKDTRFQVQIDWMYDPKTHSVHFSDSRLLVVEPTTHLRSWKQTVEYMRATA